VSRAEATGPSLIRTKLLAPVAREVVPRSGPLELLIGGPSRRLTLIRAPAGWGKSSVLGAWHGHEDEGRPFAWSALDDGDNDPIRFFVYAIEALRSLAPTIGERSGEVLRAPGASLRSRVTA